MNLRIKATSILFFLSMVLLQSQTSSKGQLFIIGGGDRPLMMMKKMIAAAQLKPADHIAILTMSSANPDTSYQYIKDDLRPVCNNTISKLHFTKQTANDKSMLDSLRKSKLIFITGGVQSRFMDVVLHTPIFKAIHEAYQNGAMIAGTSAGAAVMSQEMITGNQIRADTIYDGSFDRIVKGNIELQPGLGLLTNAIIDQHFVVRSRYNRLLTVLSQFPAKTCIGIDEDTAILVHGNDVEVVGESQVIVVKNPKSIRNVNEKLVSFKQAELSIYVNGEKFKIE